MEKIREYKNEDFDELANMRFDLTKLTKVWLNLNPKMVTLENVKEFIKSEMANDKTKYFVCEVNGKLAGYTCGNPKVRDESFKIRKYFYIHDVYVSPDFRRKGIATKLVKRIEKYAKELGIRETILNVSAHNSGVLDFYYKVGYHMEEYGLQKMN